MMTTMMIIQKFPLLIYCENKRINVLKSWKITKKNKFHFHFSTYIYIYVCVSISVPPPHLYNSLASLSPCHLNHVSLYHTWSFAIKWLPGNMINDMPSDCLIKCWASNVADLRADTDRWLRHVQLTTPPMWSPGERATESPPIWTLSEETCSHAVFYYPPGMCNEKLDQLGVDGTAGWHAWRRGGKLQGGIGAYISGTAFPLPPLKKQIRILVVTCSLFHLPVTKYFHDWPKRSRD